MTTIDQSLTRRNAVPLAALAFAAMLNASGARGQEKPKRTDERPADDSAKSGNATAQPGEGVQLQFLEIVTKDVAAICDMYSRLHGVTFGEADESLGGARVARLANGGQIGVRAPMHSGERPVVRPYILVKDIAAAVASAEKSGAEIVVPPMKIEGYGTCAIYFLGENELGLWQV